MDDSDARAEGEPPDLKARLAALARKHGMLDVYAFGSRAAEIAGRVRGDQVRSGRDLEGILSALLDWIAAHSHEGDRENRSQ